MKRKNFLVLGLALLLFLLPGEAGADVQAKWGKARGRQVSFALEVTEAVPSLVIVRLHLPTGLRIETISPGPKKRDDLASGVKLLFDNLSLGNNTVSLTADRLIRANTLTGTIMYKDPATGTMEKAEIKW